MRLRYKYKTRHNYLCETGSDGEEETPHPILERPSYLGPDPLSRNHSNFTDDFRVKQSRTITDSQQDTVPEPKDKPLSKAEWLSPISKKEKAKSKLKETLAKMSRSRQKKNSLIKPGVYGYTTDKRVSDLTGPIVPGTRRKRPQMYGTVIKPSNFYDNVWLFKLDDGRSFMCAADLIKFVSNESPTIKLVKGKDGITGVERLKSEICEQRDFILKTILNSKIHCTDGFQEVTYDKLVEVFKPQHTWLTSSKLRKYVGISRKNTTVNTPQNNPKPGTWLAELPIEESDRSDNDHQSEDSNSGSSKDTINKQQVTGRNHASDYESSEDSYVIVEDRSPTSHGVACTCCSVSRSSLLTMTDCGLMLKAKQDSGCDQKITRVGVSSGT